MSIEKMRTSEEIAKIEKERALSDAELIKGGARYKIDKNGKKRLAPHIDQVEIIKDKEEKNKNYGPFNEEEIKEKTLDLYNESLEIAKKISNQWKKIEEKVKMSKSKSVDASLFDVYYASKPPKTGAQVLFEADTKGIDLNDHAEVFHLNEKWKRIEEAFNKFIE